MSWEQGDWSNSQVLAVHFMHIKHNVTANYRERKPAIIQTSSEIVGSEVCIHFTSDRPNEEEFAQMYLHKYSKIRNQDSLPLHLGQR